MYPQITKVWISCILKYEWGNLLVSEVWISWLLNYWSLGCWRMDLLVAEVWISWKWIRLKKLRQVELKGFSVKLTLICWYFFLDFASHKLVYKIRAQWQKRALCRLLPITFLALLLVCFYLKLLTAFTGKRGSMVELM